MLNKNFYPTPLALISRMMEKIKGNPVKILEPSAGKGDIITALKDRDYDHRYYDMSAIEIDETLQSTLRGQGIRVIDSDFLNYSGPDKFDLIIANPPFDEGDKHILKAINILYRGQIIFLLNAETIKNPFTNTRKQLVKKLSELNAEIEYIQEAFKDAERPTGVEIALININIERKIEDDLFAGCEDHAEDIHCNIEKNYEVSTGKTIEELVAEYNQTVNIGIETIIGYYKNYKKIGKYIGLNEQINTKDFYPASYGDSKDMTRLIQDQINDILERIRIDFWRRTLDIKEVNNRLTEKKQSEFETMLREHCKMDFTENNIRQFVLNLIGGFEKTLTEAVVDIFNKFTIKHCYSGGLYDDNIHYFNGWKTNKAFKVNKKVIIPMYGLTDRWDNKFKLDWNARRSLHDIDIVMNYFDGNGNNYFGIPEAIEHAFEKGQSNKIYTTYFTVTCYKKGTIHLTFNSEDILRRFNLAACLGKNWLPHNYGKKTFNDCSTEEKEVIESFEGVESYTKNYMTALFASKTILQIN